MSMEKLIQDSVDCRKDHKTYGKWKPDHPETHRPERDIPRLEPGTVRCAAQF